MIHLILCICLLNTVERSSQNDVKAVLQPRFNEPSYDESTKFYPVINTFEDARTRQYYPTHPAVFYQTSGSLILELRFTIENVVAYLDSLSDWKFQIMYYCPMEPSTVYKYFGTDQAILCNSGILKSIKLSVVNVLNDSSCRITVQIHTHELLGQLVPDSLNYNEEVSLTIEIDTWRLRSNYIYIKTWLRPSKMFTKNFISDDTVQFLLTMSPTNTTTPTYLTRQFLTPNAIALINLLPEFTKSLLSIGVLLQFNTAGFIHNKNHLRLMTLNYPRHTESFEMKMLRIDWETGIMHYSPNGLRRAADLLIKTSRRKNLCRNETIRKVGCIVVTGINLLYNSLLPQDVSYTTDNAVIYKDLKDDTYSSDIDGTEVCSALQNYPKSVTVFAGVERTVLCPIICSQPTTLYGFYKGSEPMPAPPLGRDEFTRYGSVLVHKSGAAIKFDTNVTYLDSGEYSCVAGKERATFQVNVVALPSFNVTNTALTGGYLPPKIFVFEGDDYSLNCTVFQSGFNRFKLRQELSFINGGSTDHIPQNKPMHFGSHGTIFSSKVFYNFVQHSATATISVQNVPPFTVDRRSIENFNHLYKCSVDVEADDLKMFDFLKFKVESATDVVVLERPTLNDFITKYSNCCRDKCTSEVCKIQISLRSALIKFLNAVGITVTAQFTTSEKLLIPHLNILAKTHSSFNSDSACLEWRTTKGINQLPNNDAALFASLIPVFSYTNPKANWSGHSPNLHITPNLSRLVTQASLQIAASCIEKSSCVYTTAFNQNLMDAFRLSTLIGVTKEYELDFRNIVPGNATSVLNSTNFSTTKASEVKKIADVTGREKNEEAGASGSFCVIPSMLTIIIAIISVLIRC